MRAWGAGLWQAFLDSCDTDELAVRSLSRRTAMATAGSVVGILVAGHTSSLPVAHAWSSAVAAALGGALGWFASKGDDRSAWRTRGALLASALCLGATAWASVGSRGLVGFAFAAVMGIVLTWHAGIYGLSLLLAAWFALPLALAIVLGSPDPLIALALLTAYLVGLLRMEVTREQKRRGLHPLASVVSSGGKRYRLGAVLGAGGMGVVYRAVDPAGNEVAIKRLHPYWLDNPQQHKRLLREALIANEIPHPAVVPILDHGELEGLGPYLVMELLHGETLKSRVTGAGGRLPWPEVVHVAERLLDVLGSAHERGIVHCDVKPSNVFLCEDGQVKLLDFGIARPPALMVDTTLSVHVAGTPACMAPEQVLDPASIDARTDLWALGATLFWALSGEWPRALPEPLGSLEAAARLPARPIQSLVPELPAEVSRAIDTALCAEPERRWQNASEMRRCLVSFSSDEFDTRSRQPLLVKSADAEHTQEGAR